jgi:hypothetical protein
MADMKISMAQAAKIGSILVHVEEGISAKGHAFDWHAIDSLMADPDVTGFVAHLRGMALVPEKR